MVPEHDERGIFRGMKQGAALVNANAKEHEDHVMIARHIVEDVKGLARVGDHELAVDKLVRVVEHLIESELRYIRLFHECAHMVEVCQKAVASEQLRAPILIKLEDNTPDLLRQGHFIVGVDLAVPGADWTAYTRRPPHLPLEAIAHIKRTEKFT
jgi:hypothetical protein